LPSAIRLQLRDGTNDRLLSVSTAALVHAELSADCVLSEVVADCMSGRAAPQQQPQPQSRPPQRAD